eukprot:752461-Hanusia_phi.AAC.1
MVQEGGVRLARGGGVGVGVGVGGGAAAAGTGAKAGAEAVSTSGGHHGGKHRRSTERRIQRQNSNSNMSTTETSHSRQVSSWRSHLPQLAEDEGVKVTPLDGPVLSAMVSNRRPAVGAELLACCWKFVISLKVSGGTKTARRRSEGRSSTHQMLRFSGMNGGRKRKQGEQDEDTGREAGGNAGRSLRGGGPRM